MTDCWHRNRLVPHSPTRWLTLLMVRWRLMHYMRCNDWRHSLAMARGPHASVHRVTLQIADLKSTRACSLRRRSESV
jgi:hypothetical protein